MPLCSAMDGCVPDVWCHRSADTRTPTWGWCGRGRRVRRRARATGLPQDRLPRWRRAPVRAGLYLARTLPSAAKAARSSGPPERRRACAEVAGALGNLLVAGREPPQPRFVRDEIHSPADARQAPEGAGRRRRSPRAFEGHGQDGRGRSDHLTPTHASSVTARRTGRTAEADPGRSGALFRWLYRLEVGARSVKVGQTRRWLGIRAGWQGSRPHTKAVTHVDSRGRAEGEGERGRAPSSSGRFDLAQPPSAPDKHFFPVYPHSSAPGGGLAAGTCRGRASTTGHPYVPGTSASGTGVLPCDGCVPTRCGLTEALPSKFPTSGYLGFIEASRGCPWFGNPTARKVQTAPTWAMVQRFAGSTWRCTTVQGDVDDLFIAAEGPLAIRRGSGPIRSAGACQHRDWMDP